MVLEPPTSFLKFGLAIPACVRFLHILQSKMVTYPQKVSPSKVSCYKHGEKTIGVYKHPLKSTELGAIKDQVRRKIVSSTMEHLIAWDQNNIYHSSQPTSGLNDARTEMKTVSYCNVEYNDLHVFYHR